MFQTVTKSQGVIVVIDVLGEIFRKDFLYLWKY